MNELIKNITKTRIFAAIVVGMVFIWLFAGNPEEPDGVFLKCPLYWLTGWQCPFCGTQRAVHHLLHLRMERAFMCNPWLLPAGIYGMVYASGRWRSHKAVLTALVLTMMWGVVRNIIKIN